MYSEYFCRKHQTLLTAIKHIKLSASAPMWDSLFLLKCKPPRQKQMSACRLVSVREWLICGFGSLAQTGRLSEVPEGDTLPFSPHADRGWRQVSDSRLSRFDLPLQADRNPTNSTTHQLLHNSVLEAYLNTMTTLSACSLRKGCQSRFKEDLSSFKRLC